MFNRDLPYNDLPLLPVNGESKFESIELLKESILARSKLEAFNLSVQALPDPLILNSTLSIVEAKESSAIENIVTTADELFTPKEEREKTPYQKEVELYNEALYYGVKYISDNKPICTNLYIEIVKILKKNQAGLRKGECHLSTGEVNQEGNDIRAYTPPSGEEILRDLLKNLDDYLHYSSDDELIKMAVIHYQFVAIHSFGDGNGRTARIISILYMFEKGLIKIPILFLSYHILEHKDEYYSGLKEVTENNSWEKWIKFIIRSVAKTAVTTQRKVTKIDEVMKESEEIMSELFPKLHKALCSKIFEKHYVRIADLVEADFGTRKTVSKYLVSLEKMGLLKGMKVGREVLYLNIPYYKILRTPLRLSEE